MQSYKNKKDTVFVHMGPGLNSFVERELLSGSQPSVHFWDQPPIQDPNGAFDLLVNSTVKEVERLYADFGQPIQILAHSFGGHLIRPLLERAEAKISSCKMVSTGYDIPRGFLGLMNRVYLDKDSPREFKEKVENFLKMNINENNLKNHLWEMINILIGVPDFMKHYWPKEKDYRGYQTVAQNGPPLDFKTFECLVNDFLENHFKKESPYTGSVPIQISLGDLDPLLDLEKEIKDWSSIFPKASIAVIAGAGHYIHLEGKI